MAIPRNAPRPPRATRKDVPPPPPPPRWCVGPDGRGGVEAQPPAVFRPVHVTPEADADCTSCPEGMPTGECPDSLRPCGHHCNHSWSHDACCWCGATFDAC